MDLAALAGESQGFGAPRIRTCVYRAAAIAAMRDGAASVKAGVTGKDLLSAIKHEKEKSRGTRDELQRSMLL